MIRPGSVDINISEVKAEIESFLKYDKKTPMEELKRAKSRLTYYKHNLGNCATSEDLNEVFLSIVDCQEKIEILVSGRQPSVQEIDPAKVDYRPERDFLGSGVYGRVYRAVYAGTTVAIKIPKSTGILSKDELRMFKHEANIMSYIRHENIVKFLGACFDPSKVMIMTQLMATDLSKRIHDSPNPLLLTLSERLLMKVL